MQEKKRSIKYRPYDLMLLLLYCKTERGIAKAEVFLFGEIILLHNFATNQKI
jgi:hypothetical protein